MIDEWYSPDQVAASYHPKLVTWVLRNLQEIRQSGWPVEPRESVKPSRAKKLSYEARRENELAVVARITGILESSGPGGAIAFLVYAAGVSTLDAAKMLGIYDEQAKTLLIHAINNVWVRA